MILGTEQILMTSIRNLSSSPKSYQARTRIPLSKSFHLYATLSQKGDGPQSRWLFESVALPGLGPVAMA
jgi:hypothetical protein